MRGAVGTMMGNRSVVVLLVRHWRIVFILHPARGRWLKLTKQIYVHPRRSSGSSWTP